MNIYELAVAKSTPSEIAELLQNMANETERYRKAFEHLDSVAKEMSGIHTLCEARKEACGMLSANDEIGRGDSR